MIYFITTQADQWVLTRMMKHWGLPEQLLILPLTYKQLFARRQHPPGVYIFADLERLNDTQRLRAAQIHDLLHGRGAEYRLLNHPLRSMRRLALLTTLHQQGINDFEACALNETPPRFPVFCRVADDHEGSRTAVLANQQELDNETSRLRQTGENLDGWIITGFCDTADREGIYRKYSVFNIAGHLYPRHLFFSRKWVLKYPDLLLPAWLEEEAEFIRSNPHAEQVKFIFELAGIDYGRIDYSLLNGRIQVWEINTSPTILTKKMRKDGPRRPLNQRFHQTYSAAMLELAGTAPPVAKHTLDYWRARFARRRYSHLLTGRPPLSTS